MLMEENKKLSNELDNVSVLLVSVCPILNSSFLSHEHTQART